MPASLRSMTGFARVRRPLGEGEIVVSIKTVNHRGLDIHTHMPSAVDPFENAMRSLIKSKLARGHIDLRVSLPETAKNGNSAKVNRAMLENYLAAFRQAASEHALESEPDLNAALRIPGMFADQEVEPATGTETVLLGALEEALTELNVFREREGAAIGQEMLGHNREISDAAVQIEHLREGAVAAFQERLTDRLAELSRGIAVDPQRLAQEAAFLADRSDVGEEIARLKIHSAQLTALLERGGEAGKKVDFLLQEMNRETNTILSKTGGAGEAGLRITDLALAAKAAIEKIREQSLNLE